MAWCEAVAAAFQAAAATAAAAAAAAAAVESSTDDARVERELFRLHEGREPGTGTLCLPRREHIIIL
jgi:hypothetical protein